MENTRDTTGANKMKDRNAKLKKDRRVLVAEVKVLEKKVTKAAADKEKRKAVQAKKGLFKFMKPVEDYNQFTYEDRESANKSGDISFSAMGLKKSLPKTPSAVDTRYGIVYY